MQRLHSSEGRTASEPIPAASQTIILNSHEETLATLQSKRPAGGGFPPIPGKEPPSLPPSFPHPDWHSAPVAAGGWLEPSQGSAIDCLGGSGWHPGLLLCSSAALQSGPERLQQALEQEHMIVTQEEGDPSEVRAQRG